MGDASFLRRLPDPARDFIDDHVIMRRVSAQQASNANYGVVLSCFSERARGGGNFKGSRDADDIDATLFHARPEKAVVCASQQAIRDEFIEAGNDDGEAQPLRIQFA